MSNTGSSERIDNYSNKTIDAILLMLVAIGIISAIVYASFFQKEKTILERQESFYSVLNTAKPGDMILFVTKVKNVDDEYTTHKHLVGIKINVFERNKRDISQSRIGYQAVLGTNALGSMSYKNVFEIIGEDADIRIIPSDDVRAVINEMIMVTEKFKKEI